MLDAIFVSTAPRKNPSQKMLRSVAGEAQKESVSDVRTLELTELP